VRPLYFTAVAPPRIAPALAAQAQESLRPFIAYLNSAIHAAREREVRSRSAWEIVPMERRLRLEPLDTLLELQAEGVPYRVAGWIGAVPPMPLFVGAQFRPVQPLRVEEGPVVWLAEALAPDEMVYWAGQRCTLQAAPPAWPARMFGRRADGTAAPVRHRREAGGALRVVVEGKEPVTLLSDTGAVLPHRVLSASEGATSLRDARGAIPWNGEGMILLAEPPEAAELLADNGVRFAWSENDGSRRRKRGVWIQLLAPDDGDGESTIDPRAAYCEEGVNVVRTQKGGDPRHAFKVLGFRRDAYRLELDRAPPEGSTLFLPSNVNGLRRQLDAAYRLKDSPLPHHRGLLRLCEDPGKMHWPEVPPAPVSRWYVLDDTRWQGTLEQRELVQKALATPDFAFLEGPPGSGKTHAICELVLQLVERGQRVLLCSTTHVAVDNVLDRLIGEFRQVEAVRIGAVERVDAQVRRCQIDNRVDDLTERWRDQGVMADLGDEQLEAAAEATVLASANLTCGTTTGILAHPYIRNADDGRGSARWPHFDVLILDEASKTTFQELLVPALLARRWIVVGDVRQLPPFTDPRDLEASVAEVSEDGGQKLSEAHQRACLLFFRLMRRESGAGRARWLLEEPREVLDALVAEIAARSAGGAPVPDVVRLADRAAAATDLAFADVERGAPSALRLLAASWVLVPRGESARIARFLPADLLPLSGFAEGTPLAFRSRHWSEARGRLAPPVRDRRDEHHHATELLAAQQTFLREETWAGEVSWRLSRVHQLATAANERDRQSRQEEVDALMPRAAPHASWVPPAIGAIRDVGVRSVLEALRVRRASHRARRLSALTEAIPEADWNARAVVLTFQHRMHPGISALPRDLFYAGKALHDANTLAGRDAAVGWTFLAGDRPRRVWAHVAGTEERGVNRAEIERMQRVVADFRDHVAARPPRDGRAWEVACLSFYARQELAMRDMLREVTGEQRAETRFHLPNVQIVCATVDRFQGREADLVLLSLRNVRRPGHLDSPNRLNVALTRARFLLVVIGDRRYFSERCPSEELTKLATLTPEMRS